MTTPRLSIAVLLFAASFIAAAQQPTPIAPPANTTASYSIPNYAIQGTVVSAATGKPLDRATITLSTDKGSKIADATTGNDGAFGFEHVPAGRYALRASRRGYNSTAYDEHEGYFSAIVTGPNLDTASLRFKLQPQAIISGTVTDDAGDPVRNAQVTLYRRSSFGGLGRITPSGGQQTDDIGQFEFSRLAPGDYFISVTATPWYATRPQPHVTANGPQPPDPSSASSILDVAYPLTFYADATDSDSATPIPVRAGDRIQVNFSLRAVPAMHLRMPLPPDNQTRGIAWPQITQNVFGQQLPVPSSGSWNSSSQSSSFAEFDGIPPGHYELRFPNQNSERDLDLTSNATIDNPAAATPVDILGKIVMMNGGPLPNPIFVSLRSSSDENNRGMAVEKNGTFKFQGVASGTYDVQVNDRGPAFITRMAADGASTEGHQLKVGTTPINLALVVTQDSATIRGFAKRNGQGASGAMIVLVPHNADTDRELFRRDESNSDGSFQLFNVAPGMYTLIAIGDGWSLDWGRPEVLARYLPHGLKINVAISQRNITIPEALEVQQR